MTRTRWIELGATVALVLIVLGSILGYLEYRERRRSLNTALAAELDRQYEAEQPDLSAIRRLLQQGAGVRTRGPESDADSLHFAAGAGDVSLLTALLRGGADPNGTTRDGHTPLFAASQPEVIRVLAAHGADPNVGDRYSEETPLVAAAGAGQIDVVQALLDAGADPNARNRDGLTALMVLPRWWAEAADVRRLATPAEQRDGRRYIGGAEYLVTHRVTAEIAELLLRRGADPSLRDREGRNAAQVAAAAGYTDAVKVIRRHSGE